METLSRGEQALRRALTLRSGYAQAHLNLSIVLGGPGKGVEAAQEFRAAIARESDSVEAHCNLGLATHE